MQFQSEIALSMMEDKYVSLSTAMRDLLPMIPLLKEVCWGIGLEETVIANFKSTICEDNNGCLTLAKMEAPRMMPLQPHSKHYAVKYHWFWEHLKSEGIEIKKVDTKEQLADIFMKSFHVKSFWNIWWLLMGR